MSNAFLNGVELPRDLWIELPRDLLAPNARAKGLCKVLKGIYGLREAPRLWWKRLQAAMLSLGFQESKLDATMFILRQGRHIHCIAGCHVDDLIIAADDHGWQVKIKEWTMQDFLYCGRRVRQLSDCSITVDMLAYVQTLKLIPVEGSRKSLPDLDCTVNEHKNFRTCMGTLGWLATMSRPDLSYGVSRLQGHLNGPKVAHLLEANQLIREARKFADVKLTFRPIPLDQCCFAAV